MKLPKGEITGRMNEIIVIQDNIGVQNETGEIVKAWTPIATVLALVDYSKRGSDEIILSDRKTARTSVEFMTRRLNTSINPGMRIIYDNKPWDISSVLKFETSDILLIEAVQIDIS